MIALVAGILGLIVGSFLNVVVLRQGARSLSGRSKCFSCESTIAWYDNVPVVSWILLRGRCRSCGSKISIQYPLVEALTGALFATAAWGLVPPALVFSEVLWLLAHGALIALLVAIAVYDMRHTIIPDKWAYSAAAMALILGLLARPDSEIFTLLAGPITALPLFTLWYISGGRWMGLGDSKLALSIGFFLGPLYGLVALWYAFTIGAVVSIVLFILVPQLLGFAHSRGIIRLRNAPQRLTMKSEVGFGPFLVVGFFVVWFSLLFSLPLPI